MDVSLQSKIEKHEIEITFIKKSLDELVGYSKETTRQLQKIGESISKQEVILEKISNLEEKYFDGTKRIHERVDNVEKIIDNEKNGLIKRLDNIEKDQEKIRDIAMNRPCISHNVIETELKHITKRLDLHQKIFWTAITGIVMTVIVGIVKLNMK